MAEYIKVPAGVYDMVTRCMEQEFPDHVAIRYVAEDGKTVVEKKYREYAQDIRRMTAYLKAEVPDIKGQRIVLLSRNCYEFCVASYGIILAGGVLVTLNQKKTWEELEYELGLVEPSLIVNDGIDYGCRPDIEAAYGDKLRPMDAFKDSAPAELVDCVGHDDLMVLMFTSGTTGEPKMVAHDFTYPLGHIVTGSFWHNLNENSLHLTIADTGWGKAVWGKLYGQWIAGANIFVYDHEKFTPGDILEKIQNYHVTSLCAPPTIFRFLIHEDLTKFDLSSLKYCTIAGEALNPAVFDTFKKLTGIKLMEGFGQTETTLTIATMPWMQPKPGSMGLPNPQYDVDLIDHEGRSVEAGEQGQIVIRTSKGKPLGLFKEYYRDAERTHEAWHDGIYYTGDVAWKDEDGYLWFVGRADDVIKSSGYRIGPFEVESALMTHPAVVECAITGVPDEIRGQVVKATIVLSKEYKNRAGEELIKELQNHVKKVTAPYKYPRVIEFVEELPKTISGKIRRVEIRENDQK